jgi:hypothetical protein
MGRVCRTAALSPDAAPTCLYRKLDSTIMVMKSTEDRPPMRRGLAFALAMWPVAAITRRCHISAMHQFGGVAHGRTHQLSCRVF